ncbi:Lysosomal cobalamin transporter ABCD4 [Dirofilaria immitis]
MGKNRRDEKNFHFDYYFLLCLIDISKILFPRIEWAVFFMFATFFFSIASEVLTFLTGMVPGQIYHALVDKSKSDFWRIFFLGSIVYIGKCLLITLKSFTSWQLYLSWRKNAVNKLHQCYFNNHAYYNINNIDDNGIDNPDQRITEDTEKMCNQLAINILPAILIGPFVIAFYTYKTYISTGSLGIGIIYGYFIIGVIGNKFIISPMIKWNARVEKAEGDFRYKHVSIRDNAESIALYEAEPFEQYECNRIFMLLWWRQFKFMCWKLPNLFWQQFFDYYGGILSYAIQFIPILITGIYDDLPGQDLGKIISNNAFIYMYLINSFTRIIDVALSTGEMAGILQRVAELVRLCKHMDNSKIDKSHDDFIIDSTRTEDSSKQCIVIYDIHNISYSLPNYYPTRKLLNDFSFSINKDAKIMISGPNGSGKTSLIRVLSRLWQYDTGYIKYGTKRGQILRLSQMPYFPCGHLSLFQQISFPATGISDSFERIENDYVLINSILNELKLDWLIERCEGLFNPVEFEWQNTLTLSEQQRLAFARVLYQRPQFVIIDESTNSIELDIEEHIYQLLITNNIGFISITHHLSLIKFHEIILHLDGCGNYTIQSLHSASISNTINSNHFSNFT